MQFLTLCCVDNPIAQHSSSPNFENGHISFPVTSNFNLAAEFDHTIAGQFEKLHRVRRIT